MNVQHLGSTSQSTIAQNLTRYFHCFNAAVSTVVTETNVKVPVVSAGTVSLIGLFVSTNGLAASTFRFRKDVTNGNQVVTVTADTTGQFEDTTNTDGVSSTNDVNYSIVTGANSGGSTIVIDVFWHTFAPSSGTQAYLCGGDGVALSGTSDSFFSPVLSGIVETTEANTQAVIATTATLQNGAINVSANTRSDTTVFRSRKNLANGNIAIQYLTTATGVVEDTSNTDALADGDEFNWMWDQGGGTGSLTMQFHKLEVSATDAFPIVASNPASGTTQGAGLTWYHPLGGRFHTSETTEADSQHKTNVAFTLSDLYGYLSAFSLNAGDLTVRSRVNAANGNLTISFTATGQVADTSNTDVVADDDEVNYSFVTGGASGSVTPRVFSVLASATAALADAIRAIVRQYGQNFPVMVARGVFQTGLYAAPPSIMDVVANDFTWLPNFPAVISIDYEATPSGEQV